MLGLKFAYATNGPEIIEIDFFAGTETPRADYPTKANSGLATGLAVALPTTALRTVRWRPAITIQIDAHNALPRLNRSPGLACCLT